MSLIFFGSISCFVDLFQLHDVEVQDGFKRPSCNASQFYKVRQLHGYNFG